MENCPHCEQEYKSLGGHWRFNPEHRPKLTKNQLEVTVGFLMGDGSVTERNGNPYIETAMKTRPYLEYLNNVFGSLGGPIKVRQTPYEAAELAERGGLVNNANPNNYNTMYRWQSKSHPEFRQFVSWYNSNSKKFPEDISLTPTVLKNWFCCDGSRVKTGNDYISIAVSNERDNTKKLQQMFANQELPEPKMSGYESCNIRFTVEQSESVWRYMGDPLPGFSYKWPERLK